MFTMRFAMRSTAAPDARSELYGAAIDMVSWGEDKGCVAAVISEHHGSDDGYVPSPVPLAAAMAARTTTLSINVAALLLAFYEPVRLAEDLVVVDLISRGRVSYVVGIGYRDEEFAMFGVDRRRRARLVEDRIALLRRLWTGDTCDVDGRRVAITPLPFTAGGPTLAYGGGTEAAARRAGRLGMLFLAERNDPDLEGWYQEAAEQAGMAPLGCLLPQPNVPSTMFVADDPDKAWAEIGEYLLVDAVGYGRWNRDRPGTASISFATTVDELKAERGEYQIITPDEAVGYVRRGAPIALQPLAGGIPPAIAWRYVEAAAAASASAASSGGA
jgi:alkanesulfonate monooxygenase SsuD/methylene tetrahydromethanopterin reductase-like flavin-dependent oxidoreductase (luciferase family)